jgi:hypothetical protein
MRNEASPTINTIPFRGLLNSSIVISILITFGIILLAWQYIYMPHVDSVFYKMLSMGEPVKKPFSGRIFYPAVAHIIQRLSGLSLNHSFLLANTLGLTLLIFTVTVIIKDITSYAACAIPLLLTPFLIRAFSLVFLPDLLSAGLTGLFFYLLYRDYFWPSLVVLLLVYLTRENAIFLCLSLAAVGLYKYRLRWAVAGSVVLVAGMVITSMAARHGLPQEYNMNFLLYLALKVPKNFLYNVLGILIWTNVYPDVGHPYLLIALPTWLPLGKLHTIGLTPMQPLVPLNTLMLLLTTFGVAPSLLGLELGKHWKQILAENPFWLQVAIIYGVSSFLIGVAVSYDVTRLIGYAFPVFWLAVPALLLRYATFSPGSLAQLLGCHVAAGWLPWIMQIPWFVAKVTMDSPMPFLVVIFGSIILHFLAARTINRQESLNFA